MPRYSVYGSDEFEEYVANTLGDITAQVLEEIPAGLIKALVLGGGYGRSEGGVYYDGTTERLYNDLDIFVFSANLAIWKKNWLNKKLRNLHNKLSARHGLDIDFSPVVSVSRLSNLDLSLRYYDLQCGHQVLYGNPHIMASLPRWKAEDIPQIEALRLMLNRGMGLFFAAEYLNSASFAQNQDFIIRNIHKAYQALAEAILIFEHSYHSSTIKRMKLIQAVDLTKYCKKAKLRQNILTSMEFKLLPKREDKSLIDLCAMYQEAKAAFREVYYALWSLYFEVRSLSYEEYLALLQESHKPEFPVQIKNLILNLKGLPLRACLGKTGLKYPRIRLYQALPHFLFGDTANSLDLKSLLGISNKSDYQEHRDRFVSLWNCYN